MRRILAFVVAAGLSSGCFVFEEIDSGMQYMEDHEDEDVRKAREAAQAEKGKGKKDGPDLVTRVKGWLSGEEPEEEGTGAPEPVIDDGPPPDPKNVLVQCDLNGSVRFTRKFDCQLRGGRVLRDAGGKKKTP